MYRRDAVRGYRAGDVYDCPKFPSAHLLQNTPSGRLNLCLDRFLLSRTSDGVAD